MNYEKEWQSIKSAMQYTGEVNKSDIMHATQVHNVDIMIRHLIRQNKIKEIRPGVFGFFNQISVKFEPIKLGIA